MKCNRELKDGDLYSEQLTGFMDDTPMVRIICTDCALPTGETS